MLFRTVYGAELAAIYAFIQRHALAQTAVSLSHIYDAFVATESATTLENHHIDDALSFLASALMIEFEEGVVKPLAETADFRLSLLRNLRRLEMGYATPLHPLDSYYMHILSEVFIQTGRQYVRDLHAEVNQLKSLETSGGVSREKIQAWKRVMTYLGIGHRAFNGFLCVYDPQLLLSLLKGWSTDWGTIQSLLEDHFERYLPTTTRSGEISASLAVPLQQLNAKGAIDLYPLQDSPSRAFFGALQYKGIRKQATYV